MFEPNLRVYDRQRVMIPKAYLDSENPSVPIANPSQVVKKLYKGMKIGAMHRIKTKEEHQKEVPVRQEKIEPI